MVKERFVNMRILIHLFRADTRDLSSIKKRKGLFPMVRPN